MGGAGRAFLSRLTSALLVRAHQGPTPQYLSTGAEQGGSGTRAAFPSIINLVSPIDGLIPQVFTSLIE